MSLKKRIITSLLFDQSFQCVKPVSFARPYRKLGNLKQYINVVERRNIDELILLDITATEENRSPQFAKLNGLCDNLFCPVTIGGGITSLDDIGRLLDNGADKVVIKTRYDLIEAAAHKYGSQCIVFSYDYIYIDQAFEEHLTQLENLGVGEILLTSTSLDGTMKGYNLVAIHGASLVSRIPIIANGGCSDIGNMADAFTVGADAVAAGSLFLFTDITPRECAKALVREGIEVRL